MTVMVTENMLKPTNRRARWNQQASLNSRTNSRPTRLERTSETTFNVHHDDGSIFECKLDPSKVWFKADLRRTASRFHIADGIVPRNVMSNADRVRLGLEPDPALPA